MEPDIISQTAEPKTLDERRAWFDAQVAAGKKAGVVLARVSYHPDKPEILLYEGWKVRPDDQGEPRFSLVEMPDVSL